MCNLVTEQSSVMRGEELPLNESLCSDSFSSLVPDGLAQNSSLIGIDCCSCTRCKQSSPTPCSIISLHGRL